MSGQKTHGTTWLKQSPLVIQIQNLSVAALGLITAVTCELLGMSAFKTTVITACTVITLLVWFVGFRLMRGEPPKEPQIVYFGGLTPGNEASLPLSAQENLPIRSNCCWATICAFCPPLKIRYSEKTESLF